MRTVPSRSSVFVILPILVAAAAPARARVPTIEVNPDEARTANELVVALDPTNSQRVTVGANTATYFTSTDGGQIWTTRTLTSPLGVAGDPCVVYDADGDLYYGHLSIPNNGYWLDRIVVQKSTDNGDLWNDGASVGLNPVKEQDKEWLTADRTDSPWRHNLYMAWTEFDAYGSTATTDSTRILFSRSTDRGLTWSAPLRISGRGGNCIDSDRTVEGAVPAVGPEGQVYTAWSGHFEIRFARSFDGGQSFEPDVFLCTQPGGWDFAIGGIYRCNGMPVTACDVSHSPWRGRVYVLFSDQRNGTDDTDVFLCWSDDQGTNWTVPRRVNTDVGASHQFFPWLAVDPVTGLVAVVYYDRSRTTGFTTEVIVAWSRDGGTTFTETHVGEGPFIPSASVFFGDYIGIDAHGGAIQAAWLEMDSGQRSVWSTRLEFPSGVAGEPTRSTGVMLRLPAMATDHRTEIAYTTWRDGPVRLAVYDLRGRLVRELVGGSRPAGEHRVVWDGADASGRRVASGMYLARLKSGPDEVVKKVVVVN